MYLNKTLLIGNLTKDVELKALPNSIKVANFSVATNRTWKDNDGQKKESVEYHNVVAFGKVAETIAQWIHKGDQIYVEGRLQTRSWDDVSTGKKIYRTEIIAENFQFGVKRSRTAVGSNKNDNTTDYTNNDYNASNNAESTSTTEKQEEISPEDIPY